MRIEVKKNRYQLVKGWWFWKKVIKVFPGIAELKHYLKKHENKV